MTDCCQNRKNDATLLSIAYLGGKYYFCPNNRREDYSKTTWNVISKVKPNSYGFKGVLLK